MLVLIEPKMSSQNDQRRSSEDEGESVFPFDKTPSGYYKISPKNVVYENKEMSFLVAHPHRARFTIRHRHLHRGLLGDTHPNCEEDSHQIQTVKSSTDSRTHSRPPLPPPLPPSLPTTPNEVEEAPERFEDADEVIEGAQIIEFPEEGQSEAKNLEDAEERRMIIDALLEKLTNSKNTDISISIQCDHPQTPFIREKQRIRVKIPCNCHQTYSGDPREKAAIVIQSRVRGYLARKRFQVIKAHAKGLKGLLVFGCGDRKIFRYDCTRKDWVIWGKLPEPRRNFGASMADGILYIFGGGDPSRKMVTASCWAFDPSEGGPRSWTRVPDMIMARMDFGFLEFDGKLFVFGGRDASGKITSHAEKYDPTLRKWLQIPKMSMGRASFGVARLGASIWVVGGHCGGIHYTKTVEIYEPFTNRWRQGPSLPGPQSHFLLFNSDDRLHLAGGYAGFDMTPSSDVLAYYEEIREWRKAGSLAAPVTEYTGFVKNQYLIILGGNPSEEKQIQAFNTEKRSPSSSKLTNIPSTIDGSVALYIC